MKVRPWRRSDGVSAGDIGPIRDALGIEPGDEIIFEETDSGYKIAKKAPTTESGDDPFAKYRGSASREGRCQNACGGFGENTLVAQSTVRARIGEQP